MTYHLLDHVNRLNAAELAKPRDARTNMTPGWAPPSEVVFATKPVDGFVRANMARPFPRTHSLGRGDKIRCGMPLLPGQHIHTRQLDSKHYNVCRPFDETWYSRQSDFSLLSGLAQSLLGGIARSAISPNHGHGALCLCFFYAPNWDLSLVDPEIQGRRRMTAMVLSSGQRVIVHSASTGLVSPQDCEWCAGTGRIICDDERAGRVSPSHADGGYAEWQRRTMESAVAVRSGARQIGRITNMRSVDGFVVGDIELEDGSVVVERLMRSPFSSISDAKPATTERE